MSSKYPPIPLPCSSSLAFSTSYSQESGKQDKVLSDVSVETPIVKAATE